MEKKIHIGDRIIDYTLKVSRQSRSMRIAVYHDGRIIVSVPRLMNFDFIVERFILKKADWILRKLKHFESIDKRAFIKRTKEEIKAEYKKHKKNAQNFVEVKVEKFNKIYGYKIGKITIKNQKSRWGSCSQKGNLNFNYKIIHLPENLADYIVVHEICHLGELNHSKRFWNLVSRVMPEYRKLRSELNKVGINYQ